MAGWVQYQGRHFCKKILSLIENGSTLKRKEGEQIVSFMPTPFLMALGVQKRTQEVTKVISFLKNGD